MTERSTAKLSLIEAAPTPAPLSVPAPGPEPDHAQASLRRCCAAWQRAYKASLVDSAESSVDKYFAREDAGEAYCNAMPLLSGYESIRDFIACAAHGILIGAIRHEKCGQILYAAQVALGAFNCQPKPRNSPSA
jgi:hypothetical protein